MRLNVVILCAGEATRFGGGIKQLLPVGGELILTRTIRIVRKFDPSAVVKVVVKPATPFRQVLVGELVETEMASKNTVSAVLFANDLLQSGDDWKNIILLGDVIWYGKSLRYVFTNANMHMIVGRMGKSELTGKGGEIFGICVPGDEISIAESREYALRAMATELGRLWEYFEVLKEKKPDIPMYDKLFEIGGGITDDIDTIGEYETYLRRVEKFLDMNF